MTDRYVRSGDGDDVDNGSAWALAKATVQGAFAAYTTDEKVYVSQAHAQTQSAALSLDPTLNSRAIIECVNDAAEPPTTPATGGSIAVTNSSNNLTVTGSAWWIGMTFKSARQINQANGSGNSIIFENCTFELTGTGINDRVCPNTTGGTKTEWRGSSIKFNSSFHNVQMGAAGEFHWNGGAVVSGSTTPTVLFKQNSLAGARMLIESVDLSNFGTTFDIVNSNVFGFEFTIQNCKLPSGWSGNLHNGTLSVRNKINLWNCDDGDTFYRVWLERLYGTIREETTIVRSGGANNGTVTWSLKMTTNANATPPHTYLVSPDILRRVDPDDVGSPKTLTVEIMHDSATALQDNEVWLEVSYPSDTGSPLSSLAHDRRADALTAAADQASSAETWTTTGLTNPNAQKLSVTFTPQNPGVYVCRVVLAKASKTIYVDQLAA